MVQQNDSANSEVNSSSFHHGQPAFVAPKHRDAWKTIRGFVYQADLTIERWLQLSPEQELQLECGEDVDIVSKYIRDGIEDRLLEQVKQNVKWGRTKTTTCICGRNYQFPSFFTA